MNSLGQERQNAKITVDVLIRAIIIDCLGNMSTTGPYQWKKKEIYSSWGRGTTYKCFVDKPGKAQAATFVALGGE